MQVEVCAYSLESCLNAQKAGASRVELCGGLGEGGTTPSAGLIRLARKVLSIDLYVMIRPRGGDFVYDEDELDTMRQDIQVARELGADGVVLGVLLPDGQVDVARTRELIELARPMGVTFHRAFDCTADPFEALEDCISAGAERILTSGQKPTASEGKDLLARLVAASAGRIEIMAGAGVTARTASELLASGVQALHLTGKAVRPGKQTFFPVGISMASSVPDERQVVYSDLAQVEAVVALSRAFSRATS